MFKKAIMVFLVPFIIVASPLPNISPIDTGFVWEYEFSFMWGGHFLDNGHEYTTINTRRIITVDSMKILPGNESSDSTLYYITINDSGTAYITTDSTGSTIFDTLYFDTLSSIKDSVIYTEDTVITFCEIFLKNYKTESESLSVYTKDAMDTMKTNITFNTDTLNCYVEQYEHFDGQQYDKREFYFIENAGGLYLYNISSFFCAVQEYYYNLISFNGNPVIDTTELFDQIGKYSTHIIKSNSTKNYNFSQNDKIKIYNTQGKLIYQNDSFNKNHINNNLLPGSYFIIRKSNSGFITKQKYLIK